MRLFRFNKHERVLKSTEFISIRCHGKQILSENFVVTLARNRKGLTRLGITVGKRFGNSVRRNRIKRLIREFFRQNKGKFPKGYDVLVKPLIKPLKNNFKFTYSEIEKELGRSINIISKRDEVSF